MTTFVPASPIAPILPPNTHIPFVNVKTGALTIPANQHLQQMWSGLNGSIAPMVCETEQTIPNVILLTPMSAANNAASYVDFASFRFVAASNSTGTVTAGVAALAVLPVYKSRGLAVAGSGDVLANAMYELVYQSALNSGDGGFILW